MLLQIIGSFLAVVAFCFILNTPRRHIVFAGLSGAAGWAVYLILEDCGVNTAISTFLAGCMVSLCA